MGFAKSGHEAVIIGDAVYSRLTNPLESVQIRKYSRDVRREDVTPVKSTTLFEKYIYTCIFYSPRNTFFNVRYLNQYVKKNMFLNFFITDFGW